MHATTVSTRMVARAIATVVESVPVESTVVAVSVSVPVESVCSLMQGPLTAEAGKENKQVYMSAFMIVFLVQH